jgi:ssDNA-binding replication factor A large subunit
VPKKLIQAEELYQIKDLKPGLKRIEIVVKCISKKEIREVTSRKTGEINRVTEALAGDPTGCIILTLWNDDIDNFQTGNTYHMSNVYTSIFQNSLRLNIGRYGRFEQTDDETIQEVDESNNLSDVVYEQRNRSHRNNRYSGRKNTRYNQVYRKGKNPYRRKRRGSLGPGPRRRY